MQEIKQNAINSQVTRNQVQPFVDGNKGKKSFWRRLLDTAIVAVATGIAGPLGGLIATSIITYLETSSAQTGSETSRGIGSGRDYEPTTSEQTILENWLNNKFNPFYKILANELSLALSSPNINVQLAGINKALSKMCTVHSFYYTEDKAGLSAQAVEFRFALIDELFAPITALIDDSVSQEFTITVTSTTPNPSEFLPLTIYGSNYPCENYTTQGASPVVLPVRTRSEVQLETLPVQAAIFPSPSGPFPAPSVPFPSGVETIPVQTVITAPVASENNIIETVKKNKGIAIGLGLLALYLIWPSKKK